MKKLIYLSITLFFLTSCGVKYKTIPYFVDLPVNEALTEEIKNQTVLKIQKDDILAITVSSANEKASAIFNMGNTNSLQGASNGSTAINGFIVDLNGNIQLPYLGSLKVEGLSTSEARELIQGKLALGDFLKEPVISLRLANFKVSVLGDVNNPGVYQVQSERVTVIDALSMAGDVSITGIRNNVLLIRENQGKRQYLRLDLQSKDLFNSPHYYMQNNDVLYIQPGTAKYATVDPTYRNLSFIFSAISIIVLVISRF